MISLDNIVKLPPDTICARIPIHVGTICNCRCEFCYFRRNLKMVRPLEQIKDRMLKAYNLGFRELDFTGGEPSVHPKFFEILSYGTELGCYLSCLSNGWKFADMEFLKKAHNLGLKEILFSLHGCSEEQHDAIVGKPGAFKRILRAIRNAQELGMLVRINCTVYHKNYKTLPTLYADLINEIKPFEVSFIHLNYFDENDDFEPEVLSEPLEAVKQSIVKIKPYVKYINVRYVPFCYMQGFERYCSGYYQHIYDLYDWDLGLDGIGTSPVKTPVNCELPTKKEWLEVRRKQCKEDRLKAFKKLPECSECKYSHICDGIKFELDPKTKVYPVPGKKILDVIHFRHGFYDEQEKLKYGIPRVFKN